MNQLVIPPRPPAPVIQIDDMQRALELATTPAEIIAISAKLDAFEQYMHDCGLYSIEDMRPINETRMKARWKLGGALAVVARGAGRPDNSGAPRPNFKAFIRDLSLKDTAAKEAQRI